MDFGSDFDELDDLDGFDDEEVMNMKSLLQIFGIQEEDILTNGDKALGDTDSNDLNPG